MNMTLDASRNPYREAFVSLDTGMRRHDGMFMSGFATLYLTYELRSGTFLLMVL